MAMYSRITSKDAQGTRKGSAMKGKCPIHYIIILALYISFSYIYYIYIN